MMQNNQVLKNENKRDIIFADGEFCGLYADGTVFLSLALIKSSGEEILSIN